MAVIAVGYAILFKLPVMVIDMASAAAYRQT